MWFFNSFGKSLYDLNWLRARRGELGKAFSYFFLLIFLFTGLTLAPVLVSFMRGDAVKEIKTALAEKVPDFTATVAGGELSVSDLEQPYIFEDKDFVFVLDTVSTSTLRLETYLTQDNQSGMLITKDKLEMFQADRGQSRSQSFKGFPDFSVTRADLIGWAEKFLSKPMLFIYFLFFFAMMYVIFGAGKLFFTLVVSFLVFLVAKIAKKKWLFKEIYAVGLFAGTLVIIISAVLKGLGLIIPFVSTVVFLLWLGAAVLLDKSAPSPVEEIKQ